MLDVSGKGAFITGGGSGMGLGMAIAFAKAGMKVVIADVRKDALDEAMKSFENTNQHVVPIVLDVTNRDAWAEAADRAEAEIGKIHVLALNAGVGNSGPISQMGYKDWDFGLGVNLGGVVNGVVTMLPRMQAHGEDGYIFATSSTGGFSAVGGVSVYCTSKFAVAGMMETIATELQSTPIKAGVFFPGPVQTNLGQTTHAVRPDHLKAETPPPPPPSEVKEGEMRRPPAFDPNIFMSKEELGERVLRGVRRQDLFIMTHPEFRKGIEARSAALLRAIPEEPYNDARAAVVSQFGTLMYNPIYDKQQPLTEQLPE